MAIIRKIEPTDLERVAEIANQAFPTSRPKAYFQRFFQKYPNDFYVAEKDSEILGYVLGHIKAEGLGWIKTIAVRHNHQGQGIGKEMMDFITDKLAKAETKVIGLHTRTNNQKGVSFYQGLGFQITETVPRHYSNGDAAYRMEKQLQ